MGLNNKERRESEGAHRKISGYRRDLVHYAQQENEMMQNTLPMQSILQSIHVVALNMPSTCQ
jgi:hypothetical protein